jgi:hypothetical protein
MIKLFFFCLVNAIAVAIAQNGDGSDSSKQNDIKTQWLKHAKFCNFIHRMIYSVHTGKCDDKTAYDQRIMHSAKISGAEYSALPYQFSAVEWVKLVKDAGHKYIYDTS